MKKKQAKPAPDDDKRKMDEILRKMLNTDSQSGKKSSKKSPAPK